MAFRYSLALALAVSAFLLHLLLNSILGDHSPYLIFIPAVLIAGAIGGLGPGLLVTGLCLCAKFSFITTLAHITTGEVLTAISFIVIGSGTAIFGEFLAQTSERARTKTQELLNRESYLQSILDTVPDAMVVIDERGIIQSFSTAAERLFGWSAAEINGENVKLLMPSPYREGHDGYIARYLTTGERRIIGLGRTIVGQKRDGSRFPIDLSVGEAISGNRRFFIGFIRDLSQRQRDNVRLQELQSELVHISRFTALGEMASTLAHELNQPLSAIANYVKGARRLLEANTDEISSTTRTAMDRAAEQTLRAGEIVRRLRDFVAGGEADRRVENLNKLIDEAGALALVGARENGVHTRFQLRPESELVLVDRIQIQQVLFNLLRNAIEAMMKTEQRELIVTTNRRDDGMIVISVSDSGSGLSKDIASHVFQPFITTKRYGMGLGLSISRTIVEAHGGKIWVEATQGGGTTFRFTLRAVTDEEFEHAK